MKNRLAKSLLAPNLWVGISCALAVAGIVCLSVGYRKIGLWLLAPLLVGGVIVVVVLIPILIRANRKHRNGSKGDQPEHHV